MASRSIRFSATTFPVLEGHPLEMTTYELFLCWIIIMLLVLVLGEVS